MPIDVLHPNGEFDPTDSNAFADGLSSDSEFFDSFVREIGQCASGNRVESIQGDQKQSAVFTLLPLVETELDLVRELGFISEDGVVWTAEG